MPAANYFIKGYFVEKLHYEGLVNFQAIQESNLFLYRIIGEPVLRGRDKQSKTINSNAYLDTNYCMENLGYAHFKTSSLFSSHSMNSVSLLLFRTTLKLRNFTNFLKSRWV